MPTGSRRSDFAWDEATLHSIIERVLESRDAVYEISAPPGAGKTYGVVKFIVERGLDAILAFPTHQAQLNALRYALSIFSQRGSLDRFILDYAGVENYCPLVKREKFEEMLRVVGGGGSPEDAVEELALTMEAVGAGDPQLVRAVLGGLVKCLGERDYTQCALRLLRSFGWRTVCRKACPFGAVAWRLRRRVREALADPAVITWRDVGTYPNIPVVHANPSERLDELNNILSLDSFVLCPRLMLHSKLTVSKSGRPAFIHQRPSLVFTPHAALDYVVRAIRQARRRARIQRQPLLFIDEYDAMLRPRVIPVYSLDEARLELELAEAFANLDVDECGEVAGPLGEWLAEVLAEVIRVVERVLDTRVYHPVASIFVEAAVLPLEDKVAGARLAPLGPRVVHVKHFEGDRLLSLLLNPRLAYKRVGLSEAEYRSAWACWEALLAKRRVTAPRLTIEGGRVRLERRRVQPGNVPMALRVLASFLAYTPVYTVWYAYPPLRLETLDPVLHHLLSLRDAVVTSATPIHWDAVVQGPAPGLAPRPYQLVADGAMLSAYAVSPPESREHDVYTIVSYTVNAPVYTRAGVEAVRSAAESWAPLQLPKGYARRVELEVRRVEPSGPMAGVYAESLSVYAPPLPPLPRAAMLLPETLGDYASVAAELAARGNVLVLAQNKLVARLLAEAARARLVKPGGKPAYYEARVAGHRVYITWFRSRVGRGVDLPESVDYVLVVGSPYPRPRVLSPRPPLHGFSVELDAWGRRLYLTFTPHDYASAVAEFVQAVGRATRRAARESRTVRVVIPAYVAPRVYHYAPLWMRLAMGDSS